MYLVNVICHTGILCPTLVTDDLQKAVGTAQSVTLNPDWSLHFGARVQIDRVMRDQEYSLTTSKNSTCVFQRRMEDGEWKEIWFNDELRWSMPSPGKISLEEAKEKNLCRICGEWVAIDSTQEITLNYGKDFAHADCLKKAQEVARLGPQGRPL